MSEKEEFQSSQLSTLPASVIGRGGGMTRFPLSGLEGFSFTLAGSGGFGTVAGTEPGGGGSIIARVELSPDEGRAIFPADSFEPVLCSHGRTRSAARTSRITTNARKNPYFLLVVPFGVPGFLIDSDQC